MDILTLTILLIFVLMGIRKGLLETILEFFSLLISIFCVKLFYPIISKTLLGIDFIYDPIKKSIMESLNLRDVVIDKTLVAQGEFINNLQLPEFILKILNENNNKEIYNILDVFDFENYIGGLLANVAINVIASIIVFLVVFIILKLLFLSAKIVTSLPVIKTFNSTGGGIIGFAKGMLVVWLMMAVFTILISKEPNGELSTSLLNSKLSLFLYNNNFILNIIGKVISKY